MQNEFVSSSSSSVRVKGHARALASLCAAGAAVLVAFPAGANSFFFSTGDPNGLMATASRPGGAGLLEIESADDFLLTSPTRINQATFTGLLPSGAALSDVNQVVVEIYRVFQKDSVNPPDGRVPTRVNSPSDVAFASRDSAAHTLSFSATLLNATFVANNSVLNGIHPSPNQSTRGEGLVRGQEVQFSVTFSTPLDLAADHYFFVPQVGLNTGDFFWLSAPRPIVPPGTPFQPDLQTWIRNGNLDPDWLRVGTDIVDGTSPSTFNASFSLTGSLTGTVPDAASSAQLLLLALGAMAACGWLGRKANARHAG